MIGFVCLVLVSLSGPICFVTAIVLGHVLPYRVVWALTAVLAMWAWSVDRLTFGRIWRFFGASNA